jgi:uncharacterized protein YjbI with pentapeptide repeats
MKISFERRFSSEIAFEVEIDDRHKTDTLRTQRGEAIKQALKEKRNLRGSNLSDSDLSGSNLSGSNLSDSNLSGSNLSDSDLSGSNLSGSNLRGSDLRGSNLSDSDLSGSDLSGVPFIKNIHQTLYNAASVPPEALDMSTWHHSCGTTHCRAGWIVKLAGEGGAALEWAIGTPAAAAMIYIKSDPKIERIPNFYASNEDALADMKRLADLEKAAA